MLPLMLALALPAAVADPPRVEIVGHRGASSDAPENTVAAIKLAWEQKADGSEFDIYLTKDGQIAVIQATLRLNYVAIMCEEVRAVENLPAIDMIALFEVVDWSEDRARLTFEE